MLLDLFLSNSNQPILIKYCFSMTKKQTKKIYEAKAQKNISYKHVILIKRFRMSTND